MQIFAGLGNPGRQYAGQRHNVGFMAADAIHRRHGFQPWVKKFSALVADGRIGSEKVLLIKPQTFMNLSGQSLGEAMRFYKAAPEDITVFYDELDLAPGKVRVKTGGGNGGHNGVKSIDAHCGKDYRRVRIGIGHPGSKDLVTNYVLGDFAKADQQWLEPLLDAIGDDAAMLVEGDNSGFMNRMSLAVGGREPPVPAAKTADAPKPRGVSHIRQARDNKPKDLPKSGPMADMLKKLFGKADE